MAYAYTPGLKVTDSVIIRKTRRLPILGEVLVEEGDHVSTDTIVARAQLPGDPEAVSLANKLGIEAGDVKRHMLVEEGALIKEGQLLGQASSFFGLFKREFRAPFDGTVEMVSTLTGMLTLRKPAVPVEVKAYIDGQVVSVMPKEGVVVQTRGALVQGIFGVGGETHGQIKLLADHPDSLLTENDLDESCRGKVVVGGSLVTGGALTRATELGVAGIVAGGVIDEDLIHLLGYDIGVAITGQEDIALTLILTEGFGRIRMADKTFELLSSLDGDTASINGATQIRAGVMRPELIVSGHGGDMNDEYAEEASQGLVPGTLIRIIREPWFGQLATVEDLPSELQVIESGASVRVLRAKLNSGDVVTIPRANVELIEG